MARGIWTKQQRGHGGVTRTKCLAGRGFSLPGSIAILNWHQRTWVVFGGICRKSSKGGLGVFLGCFLSTLLEVGQRKAS